ncbi:hypothetical protein Tco_0919099 [Tanacetum coccineum]
MEAVSSPMVAAAKLPRTIDGVEQTYPPITTEEKLARKNELKARGTLLMALPNEHQLKMTLLKQQYENFNGSSSEGLDQTYDRLQKLISQLEILGETISQEDMNLKFLRSLPSEWKTHTLIWRNKPDLDTLSMDDLYNNLKIYETEVKGSSSSNQNSQNVAFVSSNNSGSSNQAHGSNSANTDSMSDVVIYSFFANQSNSPQLDNEDLHRRRFLNKTGRKISTNGSETIGFNKSKVKCYNLETTEIKALVAQDGLGYDWSDQAEEGPTNFALMAYTSSGSSSSLSSDSEVSTYSEACLKSYETLKEHYDNLRKYFNNCQLNVGAYKAGLEFVQARLDVYKKNEVVFEEDIKILKLDIILRDNALTELKNKFEKAEKERDNLKLTLEKFENLSKNLSKLLEIQVSDKFKTGVGYDSQVIDSQVLIVSDDKTKQVKGLCHESITSMSAVATSEVKTIESKPKSISERLIEDWISDSEDVNETEFKSKQRKPSFAKFTTNKNSNLNEKVNTVMGNVTTAGPKAVVSDKENKANAVKAPACWVWRPKQKVLDHVSRHNGASMNFKRFYYVDAQGRSKHMIGNKSYLSDYEEIDGGFVAFRGDPKGGKITGKGKISTDTECVVLSPDFKLLDENHVLLRVPRKDNMYSVDLKNIVPSGGLTCLFAKATLDESNLWHRRLRAIKFQTLNKTL